MSLSRIHCVSYFRSSESSRSIDNRATSEEVTLMANWTEARQSPRRRILDTGLIKFGDSSVGCVLRNLSDSGAALDVNPQSIVPNYFTLILVRKNRILSCNVIWRKGARIAVAFC